LDLFEFFKKINKTRKENKALTEGDFNPVYAKEDVFAYERSLKHESIVFIMNRNKTKATTVTIDSKYSYMDIETGDDFIPMENGKLAININPLSYKILRKIDSLTR
jgi:glycosidase